MLTIHHLEEAQSERVVWLCEELRLDYALERHHRLPVTRRAPPALKALHPVGQAPIITDGGVVLAESGAIVDYLLARYGDGRLRPAADHPSFVAYTYWFHFANGTLQPIMGRNMTLARAGVPAAHPVAAAMLDRLALLFRFVDDQLERHPFIAGDELTAADVMIVYSLTTMRLSCPVDLAPYASIAAYLERIGERDAYRIAMAKADPGLPSMLR